MSFKDLASLLDAATSRFTALMSDVHAEGRTARVVLTGGTAGIALLERLAGEDIDWSRVKVFFGDERNVPASHPDSNEGQARAALLSKVDIPEENIHGYGLDGGPMDAAVQRYRTLVGDGGFDLHLLGMGGEGHINSLFPHTDAVLSLIHISEPTRPY